jgi:hypothetical protein
MAGQNHRGEGPETEKIEGPFVLIDRRNEFSLLLLLLEDWGAFLDINLYREALVHFMGGATIVCRPVEVLSSSRVLGNQKLNLLTDDIAFALTTKQEDVGAMREHLLRLLRHTRLRAIQWINMNRHTIEFATLAK